MNLTDEINGIPMWTTGARLCRMDWPLNGRYPAFYLEVLSKGSFDYQGNEIRTLSVHDARSDKWIAHPSCPIHCQTTDRQPPTLPTDP